MKVQDVMTSDVRSCAPATNLATVAQIMWEADCGIVPVVNERSEVVGVVTDRDVCIALGTRDARAADVAAEEVMRSPVHTCTPSDPVSGALAVMQAHRVRRLPVVGIGGVLLGMLSLNDVVVHGLEPRRDPLLNALHEICEHTGAPRPAALAAAG